MAKAISAARPEIAEKEQVKAQIKIPKGWRRLKPTEKIKDGDKMFIRGDMFLVWINAGTLFECPGKTSTYIRKVRP